MNKLRVLTLSLLGVICGSSFAAEDPRLEARKRAREAEVLRAGVLRALSKEMPASVKDLPVFGSIEWTVKKLPFVAKGPHGGISGAGMVAVDGQVYVMGGFIPAGDETEDAGRRTSRWSHRYDPKTDQWTRLPDLPGRREYTRATAFGRSVYVLGGGSQMRPYVPLADVFCLDLSQTPLQWRTLTPMTVPRSHLSVGVIGGQLIAAGGNKYDLAEKGYSQRTIQDVTERLDLNRPETGWQKCAPIPGNPRGWCATSAVDGKLYLLGGVTWTAKARQRLSESLCYDPAQDQWKRVADFPIPMSGWSGDVFDRRHLIVIGGAGTHWNDVPFVYDTQSDRWMRIASPLPPGALFNDPGVCIIGDTIYVGGGEGAGGSHFNHFLIGKIKPKAVADIR
jgi:N-acetylneuraminic acid mutarotase